MLTEQDEGHGLVKVYWQDVRERVAKVELTFAKLVDELNPGKEFPLFLAYYPYGTPIADDVSILPKINGDIYYLNDPNAPEDVKKHLSYAMLNFL